MAKRKEEYVGWQDGEYQSAYQPPKKGDAAINVGGERIYPEIQPGVRRTDRQSAVPDTAKRRAWKEIQDGQ